MGSTLILTDSKNHFSRLSRGSWNLGDKEPSFPEFVRFLIRKDDNDYDEHWQPISVRCRMCQLSYSHIIKYESLASDWDNFVEDIQAPEDLQLPWENKGVGGGSLKQYFRQLTTEEEKDLFEKFESDFKMFGYSREDEF